MHLLFFYTGNFLQLMWDSSLMFPIFLVIKYYYEVKIGDYSSSEHNSVDRNIALFYGDGGDLN